MASPVVQFLHIPDHLGHALRESRLQPFPGRLTALKELLRILLMGVK